MAERVEKSDGDDGGDRGLTDSPNSSDSPRELRTTEGASGLEGERGAGADRQTAAGAAATSEAESERCLEGGGGPMQGFQASQNHGHAMIGEGRKSCLLFW